MVDLCTLSLETDKNAHINIDTILNKLNIPMSKDSHSLAIEDDVKFLLAHWSSISRRFMQ